MSILTLYRSVRFLASQVNQKLSDRSCEVFILCLCASALLAQMLLFYTQHDLSTSFHFACLRSFLSQLKFMISQICSCLLNQIWRDLSIDMFFSINFSLRHATFKVTARFRCLSCKLHLVSDRSHFSCHISLMRELQSTDLNETLRKHQSSFDQKTMNSESSKISKFVNRVNTEDESRWNKTVTNAYDLNLQQDKNMNETDAIRSTLHSYNWDFSATDVILETCTASSIQKDYFSSLESIFEDCSLLNASTCKRQCWYWIFAWVSLNHCSSCWTEVSRFSKPCCSWDAFISQALSHNRSIYARERKFNTINWSWKTSTWQFRSQNSDSIMLSQKRSECHILHRRSRVSVMLSRYREKEWSSC